MVQAGTHPKGYKRGDKIDETYMFTPQDVARHKNLSSSVLDMYTMIYEQDPEATNCTSLDAWLYKCMGNGFSMRFAHVFFTSIFHTLQLAGVPFDIQRTVVDGAAVTHIMADEDGWHQLLNANTMTVHAMLAERLLADEYDKSETTQAVYRLCWDPGATEFLLWDEQDRFLTERKPANATIMGVKAGAGFSATSRGKLLMACFMPTDLTTIRAMLRDNNQQALRQNIKVINPPVVTAHRSFLRKQLGSGPAMYELLGLNMDIRQYAQGRSCLWKYDPEFPDDEARRWEIPLHYDRSLREWVFFYMPMARNDQAYQQFALHQRDDQVQAMQAECFDSQQDDEGMSMTEVQACLLDIIADGRVRRLEDHDMPHAFEELMKALPKSKAVEVVYARSPDEREIRGVKQLLPNKKLREAHEDDFHKGHGHMGSGKKCRICHLLKGCMRMIHTITDKYHEVRMGYYFDVDIQTVSHRSYCGVKYYAIMRDRGSKYIKIFPLVFKDDFIVQFNTWIRRMRQSPVHQRYNWPFCAVMKGDNDGVWSRKTVAWIRLIEDLGIHMDWSDTQRKETNAYAESCMKIVTNTAKGISFQMGLPVEDHIDCYLAAVWLLNRFPPVAAIATASPDGDIARPLELVTHGWYSRSRINKELVMYKNPGSLVLCNTPETKNTHFGETKSDWMVAKGMCGAELVVFYPKTGGERKLGSYTSLDFEDGLHWRDLLGIAHKKTAQSSRLAGDTQEEEKAKLMGKFIELFFPENIKKQVKALRLPKTLNMVRHVAHGEQVLSIRPPDVKRLLSQLQTDKANSQPEIQGEVHGDSGSSTEPDAIRAIKDDDSSPQG